MKTDMTYRKWLNLVIFLITAMIILLLIVQKMYKSKKQLPAEQLVASSAHADLLPQNFIFNGLIVNNHFLTRASIQQFITGFMGHLMNEHHVENELDKLLNAWSTATPMARISARDADINPDAIHLIWLDSTKQYSFFITPESGGYFILWQTQPTPVQQLQFSPDQNNQLFPPWFTNLLQQYPGK